MQKNQNKLTKTFLSFLKSIFSAPKKIVVAIKNSYFRTLKGEESLVIVVFGWGVLLYVLSFLVGFISIFAAKIIFLPMNMNRYFFPFIWGFIMSLGIIFVFIYPLIFSFCIIKNSIKRDIEHIILAITFLPLFLFLHSKACKVVIGVSLGIIKGALNLNYLTSKILFISGIIFIILLFIYITFKTVKKLINFYKNNTNMKTKY